MLVQPKLMDMSELASPMEVISAFLGALGKKDFDTALGYVSDDCEYTNIPFSTVHGPAGVRAVLEAFLTPTWGMRSL